MQQEWEYWRRTGFVIDKKTEAPRLPTFTERSIMRDETRRQELRETFEAKKEEARERKRHRIRRPRSTRIPVLEGEEEVAPRQQVKRQSLLQEITSVGHSFYWLVTGRDYYRSGRRDQSWKRHRLHSWRRQAQV